MEKYEYVSNPVRYCGIACAEAIPNLLSGRLTGLRGFPTPFSNPHKN